MFWQAVQTRGLHNNDRPKFVKKPLKDLEAELATKGLEPTFDDSGWFTGTVKKAEPVAQLSEGQSLPDHMLDSAQFITEMRDTPLMAPFMTGKRFGKEATMTTFKPIGNPCAEIPLGQEHGILPLNQDLPLVQEQTESRLHRQGPASSVYIFNGSGFEVTKPNRNNRATVYGHEVYSGPAVEVEVYQDDAAMELEVKIKQTRCLSDCTVRFGPVKTKLSDLFNDGHWLEVVFYRPDIALRGTERRSKVYLTDGTDRYKVYSINWYELQSNGNQFGQYDLGMGFHDCVNLLRTHSSARYPKPVIQEKIVEKIIERDPFEVLAERYPRGKKKPYDWDTMVGNRTLRERFEDHIGDR